MTTFNFKRDTKAYVVRGGFRHTLDIYPDVTYSQTFNETSVPVKTLHSQYDMFENAVVNRANPANFSFTVPILYEGDLNILFNLLLDYDTSAIEATLKTADLYFETNSEVYKIEKCVMESGVFRLLNTEVMTLSLSGTGSKLSKHVGAIPGTQVERSVTRTFGRINRAEVLLNGVSQKFIAGFSVEVQNNVNWLDFATIQNSQAVTSASGTMYPGAFVVGSRALTGNIQQYVTDETNSRVNTWQTNCSIQIRVGELDKDYLLRILIPSAVFTNRLGVEDLYIQSYDFRMTSNPSQLSTVVIKE